MAVGGVQGQLQGTNAPAEEDEGGGRNTDSNTDTWARLPGHWCDP